MNLNTHDYQSAKGSNQKNQQLKFAGQQPSDNFQRASDIDLEDIRLAGQSNNRGIINSILRKKAYILALIIVVLIAVLIFMNQKVSKLQNENQQKSKQLQKLHGFQKFEFVQHKLSPLKFNYPTVGIPIPGNFFNSTRVKDQDLPEYDKVVNELFQPYNDTDCEYYRYGDLERDGGYVTCKNFFSQSQALFNIGVSGGQYDSFGCDLTSAFKIPNYLYDCTNSEEPVCPTNNDGNIFLQVCVGEQKEKDNGFLFYPLKDMIRDRRLTKKHITLKLDTEGGEYSALKYFPLEDLDYIDQIVIQLHFGWIYPEYWGHLDIFRSLAEKFIPVNYHHNNWVCKEDRGIVSTANEITLINKKLIKLKSNSRSYASHPLNIKSNPLTADCQSL